MSGWEFTGVHRHTTANLHSCLVLSVSVHFSLYRLVAKHPKSADIMLLSKWHSSGEKLLLNHMQFKWNWNNNSCLKRSIALSYQTLQCVGCISHQRNPLRPGPALNYLSLIHKMDKKKHTHAFGLKKTNKHQKPLTDTVSHTWIHRCTRHSNTSKVACKVQEFRIIAVIAMAVITILHHFTEWET